MRLRVPIQITAIGILIGLTLTILPLIFALFDPCWDVFPNGMVTAACEIKARLDAVSGFRWWIKVFTYIMLVYLPYSFAGLAILAVSALTVRKR